MTFKEHTLFYISILLKIEGGLYKWKVLTLRNGPPQLGGNNSLRVNTYFSLYWLVHKFQTSNNGGFNHSARSRYEVSRSESNLNRHLVIQLFYRATMIWAVWNCFLTQSYQRFYSKILFVIAIIVFCQRSSLISSVQF